MSRAEEEREQSTNRLHITCYKHESNNKKACHLVFILSGKSDRHR